MLRAVLVIAALSASAVQAGPQEVVNQHILPGYETFSDASQALNDAAQADCSGPALEEAYHTAFDAWVGISHIHLGPAEDQGLSLAIQFWPDPKNQTGKALARLVDAADPALLEPAEFAQVSIAAQGFMALERLLFDLGTETPYACDLVVGISGHLAQSGAALTQDWQDAFAQTMLAPGPDNPRFRDEGEVQRALYTALSTGLEFIETARLGRPMGSFDKPRPKRAEARRSGRSLRNVTLSLIALQDLAIHLADTSTPRTDAAFARAIERAERLDDPVFAGVSTPSGRFAIEVLQQDVRDLREVIHAEIGVPLGVSAGFNALDGD